MPIRSGFPDLSGYVPYTGATGDVNLGLFDLTASQITDSGLTSGRVTFAGASGLLSDSANFVWDNVNSRLGIGVASPTALIHLRGGTTAAGTAPIKLTAGNLLTSPEAGAIEYLSDKLYLTIDTGSARKEIALNNAALTGSCVVYTTNLGRLTTSTNLAYDGSSLTATVGTNKKLEFFSRSGNPCFRITNGTDVSFWDMSSASMEIINQSNSGAIYWGTADTIRLTLTAPGAFGVGTQNPDCKLHVSSTDQMLIKLSNPGTAADMRFNLVTDSGMTQYAGYTAYANLECYQSSRMPFEFAAAIMAIKTGQSATFAMYLDASQKALFGGSTYFVSIPERKVQIYDSVDGDRVRLAIGNGSNTAQSATISFFGSDMALYPAMEAKWELGTDYSMNGTQTFFLYDSKNARVPWMVSSAGNLLVNTTTDDASTAPLQVYNDDGSTGAVALFDGVGQTGVNRELYITLGVLATDQGGILKYAKDTNIFSFGIHGHPAPGFSVGISSGSPILMVNSITDNTSGAALQVSGFQTITTATPANKFMGITSSVSYAGTGALAQMGNPPDGTVAIIGDNDAGGGMAFTGGSMTAGGHALIFASVNAGVMGGTGDSIGFINFRASKTAGDGSMMNPEAVDALLVVQGAVTPEPKVFTVYGDGSFESGTASVGGIKTSTTRFDPSGGSFGSYFTGWIKDAEGVPIVMVGNTSAGAPSDTLFYLVSKDRSIIGMLDADETNQKVYFGSATAHAFGVRTGNVDRFTIAADGSWINFFGNADDGSGIPFQVQSGGVFHGDTIVYGTSRGLTIQMNNPNFVLHDDASGGEWTNGMGGDGNLYISVPGVADHGRWDTSGNLKLIDGKLLVQQEDDSSGNLIQVAGGVGATGAGTFNGGINSTLAGGGGYIYWNIVDAGGQTGILADSRDGSTAGQVACQFGTNPDNFYYYFAVQNSGGSGHGGGAAKVGGYIWGIYDGAMILGADSDAIPTDDGSGYYFQFRQNAKFADTLKTNGTRIAPVIKTSGYTLTDTDDIVVCNSTTAFTITLPVAAGTGQRFIIKNINTGTITVDGDSSDTIDGVTTQTLSQWDSLEIVDYAANKWVII